MDAREEYRKGLRIELRIWKKWWWYCWGVIFGIWAIGILLGNA